MDMLNGHLLLPLVSVFVQGFNLLSVTEFFLAQRYGCPAVEVENYQKAMPNYDPKAIGKAIPVGFIGQPSHIAKVAIFLASDDAEYIVGQSLIVDGGTTSWMPFNEDFKKPMGAFFGKDYVPGI